MQLRSVVFSQSSHNEIVNLKCNIPAGIQSQVNLIFFMHQYEYLANTLTVLGTYKLKSVTDYKLHGVVYKLQKNCC